MSYKYQNKQRPAIKADAIRFVLEDPTTHWHVNLVDGEYFVNTFEGKRIIIDGEWVVSVNGTLIVMTDTNFRADFDGPLVDDLSD